MVNMNNMISINKTRFQLNMITFIFLLLFSLLGLVFMSNMNTMNAGIYAKVFSWIGWFLLIWCVWSWYRLRNELLCPYLIFILVAFLFMYGQSLLLAFDLVPEQRDIRRLFDIASQVHAQIFTCIGLGCFHLGALLFAKTSPSDTNVETNTDSINKISMQALKITGWALFLVSVVPFLSNLISTLKIVFTSGYMGIYDPSLVTTGLNINKLSEFVSNFFVPSLFCLLVFYRKNQFMRNAIILLVLMQILSSLYIGGRGSILVIIVCFLCIWHYYVKRLTVKTTAVLLVAGYFLISLLSVVANQRGIAERDLLLYWTVLAESFGKNNLFMLTIAEMGGSMSPLVWVINLVPARYDFLHGSSYFYAFSTLIPNLGFWDVHPGALHANLGNWLMAVLGLNYGPGFSPVAEAYINFGWGGFFVLFFLGSFYGYVFSLIHRDTALKKPVLVCVIFILLSLTLMTSRNSFISTVRAVFYYALPIYLFIQLTTIYLLKQNNLKNLC